MKHILMIGAHPDDCDFSGGGTAALLAGRGDRVRFVAATNGDRGHYLPEYVHDRAALALRRAEEGRWAAAVIGATYETLGVHDGEVYVTPELTERMVRVIRSWGEPGAGPDLVLFNRNNDYHRDHRYTSQLVLDASFMLTVPLMCSETPHLARMPVMAYWWDRFHEGQPFRPDIVVPIDAVMEKKVAMCAEHASQFFEWLPYNHGELDRVPADPEGRLQFVRDGFEARAARVRQDVAPDGEFRFAEAFQICEYGRIPGNSELTELFPAGALLRSTAP